MSRSEFLPRHEQIAEELRAAIASGRLGVGSLLPSESELAQQYGVSRGTVRQALFALSLDGLIAARQGARRVVLGSSITQSFTELRSFAEWARATGHTPGGEFLLREMREPTQEQADALQLPQSSQILWTVRLRTLDGTPVFIERCCYVPRLADAVLALPLRCASVTTALREQSGLELASASHLIDLVDADETDAALLSVAVGDALLRRRGVTRQRDGAPVDYTEDRHRKGTVTFGFQTSVASNALTRTIEPA